MGPSNNARQLRLTGALLVAGTLAAFWPVLRNGFINYDDPDYILFNPHVHSGLTTANLVWAFTEFHAGNWHPVTWISHMLDCQWFGLSPRGHHFMNLILHAANSVLLFGLLRRLTGAFWRSAFVAALFALHPLHVESVAWAAERKDVLSGFFGLLTLWAYAAYVQSGERGAGSGERSAGSEGARLDTSPYPLPDRGGEGGGGSQKSEARGQRSEVRAGSGEQGERSQRAEAHLTPTLSPERRGRSGRWYALALVCFALGLMSKPMLVTLPFVLLLLDFWPLRRERRTKAETLKTEILKGASGEQEAEAGGGSAGTAAWSREQGAGSRERGAGSGERGAGSEEPGVGSQKSEGRGQTSEVSGVLRDCRGLALEKIPFFALALASSIVTFFAQQHGGAVTKVAQVAVGLRIENALVSYANYLLQLVWPARLALYYPMPESISVGGLAAAVLVLAGISFLCFRSARQQPALATGWVWYLVTLLPVIGLVQVGLQAHADRYSYLPSIGVFVAVSWSIGECAAVNRARTVVFGTLGAAALIACSVLTNQQTRLWRDSVTVFAHTVAIAPNNPIARLNLGSALTETGAFTDAEAQFREVVRLKSGYAEAHNNLGFVLALQGKLDGAVEQYRLTLRLRPGLARTHALLAGVLLQHGDRAEALAEYRRALDANPDEPAALNDLAWLLATDAEEKFRNGAEAVALAERLCGVTEFREPQFIGTLAAAYAEAGRFDDATRTVQRAIDLATAAGMTQLVETNRRLMELYRAGQAFHEEKGTDQTLKR